jgi:heavy metal sensor kinase
MNIKGVRFQLTLWYIVIFTVITAVTFFSLYFFTQKILFDHTDQAITAHTSKLVDAFTSNGSSIQKLMSQQIFFSEFTEMPGMLVVVKNDAGTNIFSSYNRNDADNIFNNLYQKARQLNKPFFQNETIDSVAMRFYVSPLFDSNQKIVGVSLLAHPIDVVVKSLQSLSVVMFLMSISMMILAIAGSYLLAGKALKPVSILSKELKNITSENLDKRLLNPKTGDEIEILSLSVNHLLDRLNQSFSRERQLIGDIAHELKTPLTILHGNLEVALTKNREVKEYRQVITESLVDTNKIATTLRNILDLAWAESDNAKIKPDKIDLSSMLIEIKELASKLAADKQIVVRGSIKPNIQINGKQDKIYRCFLNLVDNAVKYTPNGGRISISLDQQNSFAITTIKDTGVGISQTDLPHIFDRFYRGSVTDITIGSGLGLAIVKGIVYAHQGQIEVKSQAGVGTSVTVRLPVMKISS